MKHALLILFFSPLLTQAQIISTFAGSGVGVYTGDGVPATSSGLYKPYGVGMDSLNNVFIGDAGNNRIRKVTPGGIISTVAGLGSAGYNGDGIPPTAAQLNFPYGMAVNAAGTIVIADMSNHRIRSIQTESGGYISTIGGTGVAGFSGDGGPAIAAQINTPQGIFWDHSLNVYFGDHYNHRVRRIDASGIITTVAGNGTIGFSGDGGPATAAQLYFPSGVTMDNVGNLYIADMYNNVIRKVNTAGIISTIAGTSAIGYSGDGGPATDAQLRLPKDVYVNSVGDIIISDSDNLRLRKIGPTGIITTIAGIGVPGFSGDGGPATDAQINYAQGVFVDHSGNIYSGDCLNNRIRIINCVAPTVAPITGPPSDTVCVANTIPLSTTTTGGAWSSSNAKATVAGGIVTGVLAGRDTIRYTVTNSCTSVTVVFPIYVRSCPLGNITAGKNIETFSLYPNPASDLLTITGREKISRVVILNLAGQTLISNTYNAAQADVNIAALPKGLYFVRVNGIEISKFVKE